VEVINARPFKKMDGSRAELFCTLDRPVLRPLPAERYEFAIWRKVTVNIDYHVEFARHYYSVPYQLAGQKVILRVSATTVEALLQLAQGGFASAELRSPRTHH
jgi:transposase